MRLWLFPRLRPSSDAAIAAGADEKSEEPEPRKGQRSENGRSGAGLFSSVLARRQGPGGHDARNGAIGAAVGMKPGPQQADGGGDSEQDGEELAPPTCPGKPCRDARGDHQRRPGERDPAAPRLAQDLAMLEAHLDEEKRCPGEQHAGDSLLDHGFTTMVPPMSSCPLPQKTLQWKTKLPGRSGTKRIRVTPPASTCSSILKSGKAKPCLRSSEVTSSTTGTDRKSTRLTPVTVRSRMPS